MTRTIRLALAAVAVLFCAAPAAHAATFTPSANGEHLLISGSITAGDSKKLVTTYKALAKDGKRPTTIFLHSPGGNVDEGANITRMIREAKDINTVVGPDMECASICVTIFAAGAKKGVFPTARLEVHSASNVNMKTGKATGEAPGTTIGVIRAMAKLGVPFSVLGKLAATEPGDTAVLDEADYDAWPSLVKIPTPPNVKTTVEPIF